MMDLRLSWPPPSSSPSSPSAVGLQAARPPRSRATGRGAFILGVTNMAFPFVLIAWGEKHIDSGIAAIANATVPIFVALLAIRFNPERARARLASRGSSWGLSASAS